jgi:hypothetical protein
MFVLNYKLSLLGFFTLLIGACSGSKKSIVDQADKIEIKYFNNGDTLRYTSTSRSILENSKNVLKGKTQSINCEYTGIIVFFVEGSVIYAVNFSTDATGAADDCQYLILGKQGWLLSYNTGMFIDDTFHTIKKENERNNQN